MPNILKDPLKDEKLAYNELYDEVFSDESEENESSSLDFLSSQTERYEIEDEIAHGGAKKIIRVYDTRARRYLAMAIPRSACGSSDHNSFIHESWVTAQLDHPNIIKIHEVGLNKDKLPFFTMDLKNGHSLEDIIKGLSDNKPEYLSRFPLPKLLDFFIKICDAISYAHSINILHLDLKPGNIQIGEYGEVVVCDWGLAKIIGGRKSLNIHRDMLELDLAEDHSPLIMGTPGYMAPEQAKGEATSVLSDVYGLAAILYHLVTLTPTIKADDPNKAMEETLADKIQDASELASISDGLSSIIMKGLALNPDERYPTTLALQNDLSKYLEGYVTNAENPSVIKEALFFYRRNKMICLQAAFFIFLIVASTMGFISSLKQSWHSEQEARIQAEENALKRKQALDLYLTEKQQGNQVKKEYSTVLVGHSQLFNNPKFIEDPQAMLLNAYKGFSYTLEQNPQDEPAKMRLTLVLFMLQRYEKVEQYLGDNEQSRSLRLALDTVQKYSYPKGHKNVPLPVFVSALKGLKAYGHATQATAYRAILYDMKTRADFNAYEEVVEQALLLWNDHWRDPIFHYDKLNQSLRVSGDNFETLAMHDKFGCQSLLLKPLIKHLDVSNSEFKDLSYLYGSQVESLDIRNTYVRDLTPLLKVNTLRKLIITENQFTQKELKILPSNIKITSKKL
jgi:serine/threonine protein kinase